jgi:hypothetical protein
MKKIDPKKETNPLLKELARYSTYPISEIEYSYDCGSRQRVCNKCKGPIMKGEPHFSKYVRDGKYNTRYNICAFCAMDSMGAAMKRMARIKELLDEYIAANPEMKSRHEFMATVGDLTKGLNDPYFLIQQKLYKLPRGKRWHI